MDSLATRDQLPLENSRINARFAAPVPWATLLLGISIGFVGMHLFVTRPMLREMSNLDRKVQGLGRDIEVLTGMRDRWMASSDVASALAEQDSRIDRAWMALESMDRLGNALDAQADRSARSLVDIDRIRVVNDRLAELKSAAIRQSAGLVLAERVLDRHRAILGEWTGELAQLRETRPQLAELSDTLELVRRQSAGAEQARQAVDGLVLLKNDVIRSSHDIEFARRRADSLVEIVSRLRSEKCQLGPAIENLARYESIRDNLTDHRDQIVSAIDALEILRRCQAECASHARKIDGLRESLANVNTIAKSVDELVSAVRPLAELHDLRRLDDADLRAAAKAILDKENSDQQTLDPVKAEVRE